MRIVIDTNVWLVIIPRYSKYAMVYDQLKAGRFQLLLSNDILFEYEEQMKVRYDDIFVDAEIKEILTLNNVEQFEPAFRWKLISGDPDDNKFVDCAIAANADYIVTNDKHFNILKEISFPKVSIISLEEFIKLI